VPRAAFFELKASYFGRAFDDGILRALTACGYEVDVYAPDGELPQRIYGPNVHRLSVDYRRSWITSHLSLARRYDLFLGTSDLPMAFAGVFAALGRRRSVMVSDEIYIGGYEGMARLYWDPIARRAMRRADLTILTDMLRVPLQRQYAGLGDKPRRFVSYPCCYSEPYRGRSREEARRALGIADDELVLSFTGSFTERNGAQWLVRLIDRTGPKVRVLVQTGGRPDAITDALLTHLDRQGRVLYRPDRVEWLEAPEITIAADVSCVFYLTSMPDFQNLGASSQKLCTSLWIGVPVLATWQPSFAFIDNLQCGVTFDGEEQLDAALARLTADRPRFAANTTPAVTTHIRPTEHLREVTDALRLPRAAAISTGVRTG
jgi:glycosyltransferase involved in cell wall biosynthesis